VKGSLFKSEVMCPAAFSSLALSRNLVAYENSAVRDLVILSLVVVFVAWMETPVRKR
jgi:hypothetical protein